MIRLRRTSSSSKLPAPAVDPGIPASERPLVWCRRWRTVICAFCTESPVSASAGRNCDTYRSTGASSSRRPCSTNRMIANAVNAFVVEPNRKGVSGLTSTPGEALPYPEVYSTSRSLTIAMESPGILYDATVFRTNSSTVLASGKEGETSTPGRATTETMKNTANEIMLIGI